tara:strand:- start:4058 stop:4369 length:312 start_codon:yes stop_codon:yes gene_type:complete
MELEIALNCGCSPNFKFKSKYTYNKHLESNKHKTWEKTYDIKNYKKDRTEIDNQLMSYKIKLENALQENIKLEFALKKKKVTNEFYLKNFIILHIILCIIYSF